MTFLADECIPLSMVTKLKELEVNIHHILDEDLQGISDQEVFNFIQKKNLTLVTFDRGFGDPTRFDIGNSPGIIILLSPERFSTQDLANKLSQFFKYYQKSHVNFSGKLVIISGAKTRVITRNYQKDNKTLI